MPEPPSVQPSLPAPRRTFRISLPGGQSLSLGPRTLVMGIVNVTPDSFSDGGRFLDTAAAIEHGVSLAQAGADLVDVGAESARPGAEPVPADEERRRLLPVLRGLAARLRVPISVDTTKPEVARDALVAGAVILNDVSLLRTGMARVAAESGAALTLMHSRGTPATMRSLSHYPGGVLPGVRGEIAGAVAAALEAGVSESSLLVDPGIGFAKTADQSLELLARLPELAALNLPLVVGVSRKSFIGEAIDRPLDERREGTLAAETAAAFGGAHVLRTHDVAACRRAVDLVDAMRRAATEPAA